MRWLVALALVACSRVDPPAKTTPVTPVYADPEIQLESMQVECDSMVAALSTYKECPNLEDEDRDDLHGWIEIAQRNFEASTRSNPDANAQRTIAAACRKATVSVSAAHERCKAGKRPTVD